MTLWGLVFGLLLGGPYGVFASTAQMYIEGNVLDLGLPYAAPVSLSEAFSPSLGLPFSLGLIFGAILGISTGVVDGVALYFLTAFRHDPPHDARRYRRSAGLLCAVASLVPFFGPLREIMFDDTLSSGEVWLYLALSVAGPSLVAMVVMWWAGRRVARQWYKRESLTASDYE